MSRKSGLLRPTCVRWPYHLINRLHVNHRTMELNDMNHKSGYLFKLSTLFVALLMSALTGFAQINPGEITDPQLRGVEQSYLPKLIEINHAVAETKFPFLF